MCAFIYSCILILPVSNIITISFSLFFFISIWHLAYTLVYLLSLVFVYASLCVLRSVYLFIFHLNILLHREFYCSVIRIPLSSFISSSCASFSVKLRILFALFGLLLCHKAKTKRKNICLYTKFAKSCRWEKDNPMHNAYCIIYGITGEYILARFKLGHYTNISALPEYKILNKICWTTL